MRNVGESLNGPVIGFIYMSMQGVLVLSILIYTYNGKKSFKENLRQIWKRRSIYGTVLVQIFDQSSDIGVLILWWQYALKENDDDDEFDIPHVDMIAMLTLSLTSLILSRLISALVVIFFASHKNTRTKYLDAFLCLLELYVIKQVYLTHKQRNSNSNRKDDGGDTYTDPDKNRNKQDEMEATPEMQSVKWVEAIFELFPQTVLQSVFILRTYGTQFGDNSNDLLFFLFSLFWSVISISNKFITIDEDNTIFDVSAHKAKLKTKVKLSVCLFVCLFVCVQHKDIKYKKTKKTTTRVTSHHL